MKKTRRCYRLSGRNGRTRITSIAPPCQEYQKILEIGEKPLFDENDPDGRWHEGPDQDRNYLMHHRRERVVIRKNRKQPMPTQRPMRKNLNGSSKTDLPRARSRQKTCRSSRTVALAMAAPNGR